MHPRFQTGRFECLSAKLDQLHNEGLLTQIVNGQVKNASPPWDVHFSQICFPQQRYRTETELSHIFSPAQLPAHEGSLRNIPGQKSSHRFFSISTSLSKYLSLMSALIRNHSSDASGTPISDAFSSSTSARQSFDFGLCGFFLHLATRTGIVIPTAVTHICVWYPSDCAVGGYCGTSPWSRRCAVVPPTMTYMYVQRSTPLLARELGVTGWCKGGWCHTPAPGSPIINTPKSEQ